MLPKVIHSEGPDVRPPIIRADDGTQSNETTQMIHYDSDPKPATPLREAFLLALSAVQIDLLSPHQWHEWSRLKAIAAGEAGPAERARLLARTTPSFESIDSLLPPL